MLPTKSIFSDFHAYRIPFFQPAARRRQCLRPNGTARTVATPNTTADTKEPTIQPIVKTQEKREKREVRSQKEQESLAGVQQIGMTVNDWEETPVLTNDQMPAASPIPWKIV